MSSPPKESSRKKKKERDLSSTSSKDGKSSSSSAKSPVGKIASVPRTTSSSEFSGLTDREKALADLFEGKSSTAKKGSSSSTSRDTSRDPATLGRKHKQLVKKLRVNGVKVIDKIQTSEISQKDVSKVDSSELTVVYYKLNQFADKIGRDSKNEPEYFFKGLLKMPTAKELEALAAQDAESQPTGRGGDDSEDSDDAEEEVEYPENFTIQLETGGRSSVPFDKNLTVKQGVEKIASSRGMKISEWMFVTLSGQPVDVSTPMGKVPGFAIMCVKKS